MKKSVSKKFFLISFLPAIAYWYLEANYPVRIAVGGGLALASLELILEKIFTKHLHTLSKFNFFLIAFLGGLSLLGDEGLWFKLQPMITGVVIGSYLLFRLLKGNGLMIEMMKEFNDKPLPELLFRGLERDMAMLFFVYGLFMGGIALWASTDHWLFFKTIGFYIVFIIFTVIEMLLLRRKIRVEAQKRQKERILAQFRA